MAASHLFLGEYAPAISTFNVAITHDDLDFDAHLGLAIAYLKSNSLEQAKRHFQKAQNILQLEGSSNVKSFENSYWYQSHYFYFNENYQKLKNI